MGPARGGNDPRSSARDLLDQLMGEERNLDLEAKAKKKFWEADVCKFYLCGLSPYHLLKNTRGYTIGGMDAWVRHAYTVSMKVEDPGSLRCDVNLKAQYDALSQEEKDEYGYERNLFDCLASLKRSMERRIATNQEKVATSGTENLLQNDPTLVARLAELDSAYKAKVEESEALGESGEIEESMTLLAQAEAFKAQKKAMEETALKSVTDATKRFVVCQTTGDLIENAAAADDAWMASHFESDDFQGWKTIHEWHDRLAKTHAGKGRGPNYRGGKAKPGSGDDDRHSRHRRRRDDDDDDRAAKATTKRTSRHDNSRSPSADDDGERRRDRDRRHHHHHRRRRRRDDDDDRDSHSRSRHRRDGDRRRRDDYSSSENRRSRDDHASDYYRPRRDAYYDAPRARRSRSPPRERHRHRSKRDKDVESEGEA